MLQYGLIVYTNSMFWHNVIFPSVYQNSSNKVSDGQWWNSVVCMDSDKLLIEILLSSANLYNEVLVVIK